MSGSKKQSEQHLIDRAGQDLLRSKLPKHWILREYRPDYGLDFALETFEEGTQAGNPIRTRRSGSISSFSSRASSS